GASAWKSYVKDHLLGRLFGFELLAAPYAVAHLKLALQLENSGYEFAPHERIGVYLTNTLEEMHRRSKVLLGHALTEEADAAAEIKNEKPVLAVIGNPPYSGHSANKSKDADGKDNFIGKLLNDYKKVDGGSLGERNPKWLQDDYVKFIRFAEWRVAKTGHGIVAFITNHGYLDNPTFRGMRAHLMETFDEIWMLDLHGNSRKKETAPDGGKDENVFDIQQGVAILLAVKKNSGSGVPPLETEHEIKRQDATPTLPQNSAVIHHADVWGLREQKYFYLLQHDVRQTQWETLAPATPNYLFIPQDNRLRGEYEKYFSVTEIFPVNSVGVVTGQDTEAIKFSADEAELVAKEQNLSESVVRKVLFRPFDIRWIVYDKKMVTRQREKVMRHMLDGENFGLCIGRAGQVIDQGLWDIEFCTEFISDFNLFRRGGNVLFSLYLYPSETRAVQTGALTFDEIQRQPNINPAFTKVLSEAIGKTPTPEEIFSYIYAVFHAPWYREKYAEFLRIDFPRVPPPPDKSTFETYANTGSQLVALHLLSGSGVPPLETEFEIKRQDAASTQFHRFEGD
ncbi:MAG: type ISP restriction/modification enzyme, partial [Abditibacteriaceae bacterium]